MEPGTEEKAKDMEHGKPAEAEPEAPAPGPDGFEEEVALKKSTGNFEYDIERFPVREWEFVPPGFKNAVAFNPVVSCIGVTLLWALAIWCAIDPKGSVDLLVEWRGKVTLYFTWLFIGARGIIFFFLVYIAYRYGNVKLGPNDEPAEFTTGSYFAMIFAAGVAVGLFVYGVSEPLWHRAAHYYANAGYRSQDEIDMFAINMTVTNWGISGWAVYLIVAVPMALAGHRFNFPMTFRSCFYPIFGEYTWGWIGDAIDGFAIVVSVAGVCTSLGLGAIQVVAGFQFLGWVDDDISQDRLTTIQNGTIWAITAIATVSVISGLNAGVKFLSQFAFMLGMLLLTLVFVMDDTKFLLNVIVQEIGYFLQNSIFVLNFWTDAYGQLREGSGRAVDGKAAAVWWMDAWVVFYQAWWVSWACFVGLFVARISRGRTVSEVIIYSMVAPIFYCILWFGIWGGAGIRQARQAEELIKLGEDHFENAEHFAVDDTQNCYNVPQESLFDSEGNQIFENLLPGVTPVCIKASAQSIFNVLYAFSFPDDFDTGLGPTLTVLLLIGLAIYFATSSDSGSLVVDHLSANGRKNHHWIQRLFWALTEGAVATALLAAGGSNALQAVQAGSIIAGLPFCVMLVYIMETTYVLCKYANENPDSYEYELSTEKDFDMPVYGGIFNIFEFIFSLGAVHPKRVERGMDSPTSPQVIEFFKGLFVPFVPLWQIVSAAYPRNVMTNLITVSTYSLFFYGWIALFCVTAKYEGMRGWAWSVFFAAGTLLAIVRNGFRARYNIRSNAFGDFVASFFFWPQVLTQMVLHCDKIDSSEVYDA